MMMKRVIAICNLHDNPNIGVLTKKRPLGAVTFLGRYGIMDFALSNFSNSEIDKIFVLVKNGILAIRSHIKGGVIYLNNTRLGFVSLLFNEEALHDKKINTDLANANANLDFKKFDCDYIIVAPSYMLASIDYRPLVAKHAASDAEVSVVYSNVNNNNNCYKELNVLSIDEKDRVLKISKNNINKPNANICLESYIVSKDAFNKIMDIYQKEDKSITAKKLFVKLVNNRKITCNAIKFDGYFVPITSLENYIKYSFDLLSYHVRTQLFKEDWPIYSTNHNAPPAKYGPNAEVCNSFISNGCEIYGTVTNCILSRDVYVEEGAKLTNCIIFTGGKIYKNAQLKYVLADKKCIVNHSKKINGKVDEFYQINYGETVK